MGALATTHLEVLERIAQAKPLAEVLGSIVDVVESELEEALCSILLYDGSTQTLHRGASARLPRQYLDAIDGMKALPTEASCGAAASLGAPMIVADIDQHANWERYRAAAREQGLRSCWSSPIKSPEGEVLGTFAMYHKTPGLPGERDFEAVEIATHAAAIAIMRTRFDDSLRQSESRARQLARLYAVSSAINEAIARVREPKELYQLACQIAVEKGLARLAWVCTYEGEISRLRAVARFGHDEGYVDALVAFLGSGQVEEGYIARALYRGQATVINDVAKAPEFAFKEMALGHGLASLAVFPFDVDESTKGVLAIGAAAKEFFQAEEIDVLTALAADLSFAVQSAGTELKRVNLVDVLGRRVQELTALHKLSRVLESQGPLDASVLADVASAVLPALSNAEGVRLRLGAAESTAGSWSEMADVLVQAFGTDRQAGTLEVARAVTEPGLTAEERDFIRSLTEMLARYLRRTERETELAEKQALLAIAGRAAKLGGVVIELEPWRMVLADETCAMLDLATGTTLSEREVFEFLPAEQREPARQAVWSAVLSGQSFDTEFQALTRTGRSIWLRVVGDGVRDARGEIAQIHGALQDVTDRRKLEHQFRQAQKMEAVGTLAGGVAHDFNNLLSVIMSYSQLAAMPLDRASPVRADLKEIEMAARRASELTRQLLAFSRQGAMTPRVVNLNEVIFGMEKMLSRLVGADVEVVVSKSDDLGQVLADRGQLEQVLMNLVVNARDAMPRGGRIFIETSNVELDEEYAALHMDVPAGPFVLVAVSDTGEGMSAAVRERVFEPFFTTKEQGKGTGLGLSTVWGIVKQSGGHIWVYSELGVGTTFKIYLPRIHRVAEERVDPEVQASSPRGDETVLLVEDDPQLRALSMRVLKEQGYAVLQAANGEQAVQVAAAYEGIIHLVLTDVVMPKLSGLDLLKELRGTRPDIRALLVSGYTREVIARCDGSTEQFEFLPKPLTPGALLSAVRGALDA